MMPVPLCPLPPQAQYLGLPENIRVRRAGFAYRAEYARAHAHLAPPCAPRFILPTRGIVTFTTTHPPHPLPIFQTKTQPFPITHPTNTQQGTTAS